MFDSSPLHTNSLDLSINQSSNNLLNSSQTDWIGCSSQKLLMLAGDTVINAWQNQTDPTPGLIYATESIFKNDFAANAQVAFGQSFDVNKAEALGADILNGKYGVLPDVQFLSNSELNGASGVYVESSNTIYLNSVFIAENAANPIAVGKVLVEEQAHFLDAYANPVDSPGDEGEILAQLISGQQLSADQIAQIRAEDDSTTIIVDGQKLIGEQSTLVTPTINITATDMNASETLTGQIVNSGQFTLTRTGNTAAKLQVNYTVAGTANNGTDYNRLSGTATFASGSATALININPIYDTLVEGNETVTLQLTASTTYNLGINQTATITISDDESQYSSNQLSVKLPSGLTDSSFRNFAKKQGVVSIESFEVNNHNSPLALWRILNFANGTDLEVAKANFAASGFTVQYNYHFNNNWIPNDSQYSSLWGLNNTGQNGGTKDADIDAPEAWDISKGSSSVVVAVIDTGIDYKHQDLAANIWQNSDEIAGNGIDDDQNGFIDDIYGYDFRNDDGNPMDDHGHGTHVAGTIGAVGNNKLGVIGVSPNVKLMGLKFLGSDGNGSTDDAAKAIIYAVDNGAKIINASFGSSSYNQLMYDAISYANDAGVLLITAAGNNAKNTDENTYYPTNYDLPNIISVAATTNKDQLASFSNYGATTVDLGAPGEKILSTLPNNKYGQYSGTSMAAPYVTGAAASLLGANPNLTAAQIKNALLTSTDNITALQGKTVTGGRLNLYKALTAASQTTINTASNNTSQTSTTTSVSGSQSTSTKTSSTANALTRSSTISSTATDSLDYAKITKAVTYAVDVSSAGINFNFIDDSLFKGNKTVVLSLNANNIYQLGTNNTVMITIADHDLSTNITAIAQNVSKRLAGTDANWDLFALTKKIGKGG